MGNVMLDSKYNQVKNAGCAGVRRKQTVILGDGNREIPRDPMKICMSAVFRIST